MAPGIQNFITVEPAFLCPHRRIDEGRGARAREPTSTQLKHSASRIKTKACFASITDTMTQTEKLPWRFQVRGQVGRRPNLLQEACTGHCSSPRRPAALRTASRASLGVLEEPRPQRCVAAGELLQSPGQVWDLQARALQAIRELDAVSPGPGLQAFLS